MVIVASCAGTAICELCIEECDARARTQRAEPPIKPSRTSRRSKPMKPYQMFGTGVLVGVLFSFVVLFSRS